MRDELRNCGIFQKLFLTCTSSTVTMVCELPASKYFSALDSTTHCLYSCAQLSKGVLHGKIFPPLVLAFALKRTFQMFILS